MRVELVDLAAQYQSIRGEIDGAIQRILDNTSFILGDEVRDVRGGLGPARGGRRGRRRELRHGRARALPAGAGHRSGRRGDHDGAHVHRDGRGDHERRGATPVFADIDPVTYNLDPVAASRTLITDRTRADHARPPLRAARRPRCRSWRSRSGAACGSSRTPRRRTARRSSGRRCGSIGRPRLLQLLPGQEPRRLRRRRRGHRQRRRSCSIAVRRMRDHGRTTKYEHDRGRLRRAASMRCRPRSSA